MCTNIRENVLITLHFKIVHCKFATDYLDCSIKFIYFTEN
jgi:hypothetical protein